MIQNGRPTIRINPWEHHPQEDVYPPNEHYTRSIGDILLTVKLDQVPRLPASWRTTFTITIWGRHIAYIQPPEGTTELDTEWADRLAARIIPLISRCPRGCHATNVHFHEGCGIDPGCWVDLDTGDEYRATLTIPIRGLPGYCLASQHILMPDGTCVPAPLKGMAS